jgi:hypothetical protein
MINEVQTRAFAATSCNFQDMSIAPTTPDCILSLRDGSSIAATSARLHGLLAQHQSSHQPSGLPVYALIQPPAAVKLLHSILEDEVDPMVGHMPSLSSILQLAYLCAETGYTSLRESHIMPWTRRWMLSALQVPKADILQIALVCKDERAVMDILNIFVLAKVSQNELRIADRLLPGLTDEREQLHRWDQLVVISTDGVQYVYLSSEYDYVGTCARYCCYRLLTILQSCDRVIRDTSAQHKRSISLGTSKH